MRSKSTAHVNVSATKQKNRALLHDRVKYASKQCHSVKSSSLLLDSPALAEVPNMKDKNAAY